MPIRGIQGLPCARNRPIAISGSMTVTRE